MSLTRRDLARNVLAGLPLAKVLSAVDSKFSGVQIGAISYSFRNLHDLDQVIDAFVQSGAGEAELMSNHAETAGGAPSPQAGGGPPGGRPGGGAGRGPGPAARPRTARPPMTEEQIAAARERSKDLRDWRLSVSMDKFKDVRKKFDKAGVNVQLLCFNMSEAITDDEIDYAFNVAKALGAKAISTTTQVTVSKRVAPFADKHKMMVGFHGHDATWDPNEFATPESFATAMSYSKYNGVNLDIGHFTAAGYDAVDYINQHHDRITNLHIKDRMKDHGPNKPFGEAETPIKEVLVLLKQKKYPIPANIEYEYGQAGMDPVEEVKKCIQYCKDALA